jgi:hypothetical protein
MSRVSNLRAVDPVLSSLAIGYSNAGYIADKLFPLAPVKKEAGKIPKHNKDAFKVFATLRALRTQSNVLRPSDRDFINFSLEEHDLAIPMDYREADESDDLDVEQANTFLAMEGIGLRRELAASELAFNPNSYAVSHKESLSSTEKWDVIGVNPLPLITHGGGVIRKDIARRPNLAACGAEAFDVLKNNAFILERMSSNQLGILTPQLLAQILGVQEVVVGDAIYVDDNGVAQDIWPDSFLLYYGRPPGPNGKRSVYEPNFGYTVVKKTVEVDKYPEEGGKITNVRATMIYKTVLTGADAGFLISGVKTPA